MFFFKYVLAKPGDADRNDNDTHQTRHCSNPHQNNHCTKKNEKRD